MSARRVLAIVGTKGPFPRLVTALAEVARASGWDIAVQYAGGELPPPLTGWAQLPRAELMAQLAAADALVCHAGSGTLREALAAGHRPIVVPRRMHRGEHVDDHQLDLATALGERVVLLPDLDGATLAEALRAAIAAARRQPVAALPGDELRAAVRAELALIADTPPRARTRAIYALAERLSRYIASRRAPS